MTLQLHKVAFLDFDGVLHRGNTGTFRKADLLEELLVRVPDLHVVLSTNWRHTESLEDLREYFVLPQSVRRIVDVLPVLPLNQRGCRQQEIELWLRQHPGVRRFVALDDSVDLFDAGWPHLHLVDPREGLTPDDIESLVRRLA